jgi:hypothetical protein
MGDSTLKLKAWTLISLFGLILGSAPLIQIALEWGRGERIQAVDLLRYSPRSENLRRYERTLEERSWVAALTRPMMREAMFKALGEPGQHATVGEGGWLFYRPGVRYLVEPDRRVVSTAETRWKNVEGVTRRQNALRVIRQFRDQLLEREIRLLLLPVPGKASVYPDRLSGRYAGRLEDFRSPTQGFLEELVAAGVEVVDLFNLFRERRASEDDLYLGQDTHWTPRGAELAAEAVGNRLGALGWVESGTNVFGLREARVRRMGDIIEMTQVKGLRRRYPGQVVTGRQVVDPELGLLVPPRSERPGTYRDPRGKSQVLLLGDSFSRVYQYAEPQSLGERLELSGEERPRQPDLMGATRLYPGSAGLVSHLARALGQSVDAMVSDGGASTDVRRRLSMNPEILEGKRVVVWQFVERDLQLGEWDEVPLPRRLGGGL